MCADGFWEEPGAARAAQTFDTESRIVAEAERLETDAQALGDLLRDASEADARLLLGDVASFVRRVRRLEHEMLFAGEHDQRDAVLTVRAGAGGTEAQAWADKLVRMYSAWAANSAMSARVLDWQEGAKAGLQEATLLIRGRRAYGWLAGEEGVHRLQRISPFDRKDRRQTSFAAVSVEPYRPEPGPVDIDESDVLVETFRGSGPGGQHRNKVETAVRLRHPPSGIVVSCQSERSQHRNRERAWQLLLSGVRNAQERRRLEERAEARQDETPIGFGHRRRTYSLAPESWVRDHRSGTDVPDADRVLAGELDLLLRRNLLRRLGG